MSLIKVSYLIDYNEALFQEGHCLVTALLLLKKWLGSLCGYRRVPNLSGRLCANPITHAQELTLS
ncbi:MAG: hypothetical protein V9G17_19650 [Nitrospira sp.]|nr:hypothetical protein [Nitrospira sp.]HQY59515.1 hypothetical protein [Nitrospira sp.]